MTPGESAGLLLGSAGVRVLLIGSGTFLPGSRLADVPAIADTVRDLGRCLVERAGLAPAYLTTLLDPANPQEVGAAVVEAARQADGVLVVYYVGHGLVSARNELYLSTQATLNLNEGIPAHQALPYSMLREALSDCSALLTLVVLDCCFAGRAQEVVRARHEAEQAFNATPSGMYLLTSTDSDQYAWAPPGQGHTAFTGALIDLLTAGDPVAPPLLTLDDIYRSLSRTLTDQGLPAPRRHAVDHTDRQPLAPNPSPPTPPTRPDQLTSRENSAPIGGWPPSGLRTPRFSSAARTSPRP